MKKIIVLMVIFYCIFLWLSIINIEPKNMNISKSITMSPTINYYREDLYAQCAGLKYFDEMMINYPSIKINKNFIEEYKTTLNYIERDKKMLDLGYFKCP